MAVCSVAVIVSNRVGLLAAVDARAKHSIPAAPRHARPFVVFSVVATLLFIGLLKPGQQRLMLLVVHATTPSQPLMRRVRSMI